MSNFKFQIDALNILIYIKIEKFYKKKNLRLLFGNAKDE